MYGTVEVLLPTYNGAKFLLAMLKSISAQSYPNVLLTVRDDGSSDETHKLLLQYADCHPNMRVMQGERLGAMGSFFYLLQHAASDTEYFAFCDQDDVWLPDKVERAVAAIREHRADVPVLYCSRIECVDEELRHLGYLKVPRRIGFANALVENIAAGCTMVLNRRARNLICERLPLNAPFHDWWCYLAISALGEVIYDPRPAIKYRQHANNHTGATASAWELFRLRRARFLQHQEGARLMSDQAVEFKRCFGGLLSARDKEILDRFLSVRGSITERISYSAAMDVWRQSRLDTALLRALILMGRA